MENVKEPVAETVQQPIREDNAQNMRTVSIAKSMKTPIAGKKDTISKSRKRVIGDEIEKMDDINYYDSQVGFKSIEKPKNVEDTIHILLSGQNQDKVILSE